MNRILVIGLIAVAVVLLCTSAASAQAHGSFNYKAYWGEPVSNRHPWGTWGAYPAHGSFNYKPYWGEPISNRYYQHPYPYYPRVRVQFGGPGWSVRLGR